MSNSFSQFKQQVDQALSLVESASVIKEQQLPQFNSDKLVDTQSLLKRCEQVCDKHQKEKPTIRIIHHLACSGGTLISKCISAMPNVYLLSEVHPYTDCSNLFPSLNMAKSEINSSILSSKKLSEDLFISNIKIIHQHVQQLGGELVIRDNAYIDYLYRDEETSKSIVSLLEEEFNIISVVLYRDAIETYESLSKEEFYGGVILDFDEFCERVVKFLTDYSNSDLYMYEAIKRNEKITIKKISLSLKIKFNELYDLIKN